MKHQEKKYRVTSFEPIQKILAKVGAQKGSEITTTHYYAVAAGNNVTKLVAYRDGAKIHLLESENGKFSLKQTVPIENTAAGLRWLRDMGYTTANIIKMMHTNYPYKDGIVGLYMLNDFLNSVILDFPEGQHEAVAKELGLDKAEVITIPYNKFLEQLGQIQSIDLID